MDMAYLSCGDAVKGSGVNRLTPMQALCQRRDLRRDLRVVWVLGIVVRRMRAQRVERVPGRRESIRRRPSFSELSANLRHHASDARVAAVVAEDACRIVAGEGADRSVGARDVLGVRGIAAPLLVQRGARCLDVVPLQAPREPRDGGDEFTP